MSLYSLLHESKSLNVEFNPMNPHKVQSRLIFKKELCGSTNVGINSRCKAGLYFGFVYDGKHMPGVEVPSHTGTDCMYPLSSHLFDLKTKCSDVS